ncbi:MAG: biotin/lipoyl-binding protein, partial [Alphaproteobacteria bacterium]
MRLDMISRGISLIFGGLTAQPRRMSGLPRQAAMAEPQLVQHMMVITALTITGLLMWAWLARLDDIARAGGILVAHGNNAVVQHTQGGTLQTIYVKDGQYVTAGQPLLKLSDTDVEADAATIRQRMEFLSAQVQRLGYVLGIRQSIPPANPSQNSALPSVPDTASLLLPPPLELAETEPTLLNLFANIEPAAGPFSTTVTPDTDPQTLALQERYRTLQSGVTLARDEYQRQLKLRAQGFATQSRVYAAERDMQSQVQAFAAFQSELAAQYAAAVSEYTQQDEQLKKINDRQKLTLVRAPTAGIVQSLRLNTPGATVPAGTTLLEIVPADAPL